MAFSVICECGATRPVEATDAGSRVRCHCGREIAVPALSALKASVGQSAMSAEVRVDELLKRGLLPRETACVVCQRPTPHAIHAWTVCERVRLVETAGWKVNPVALLFGWIWARRVARDRTTGRDLRFRLPVRVCPACAEPLGDPRLLKETLRQVPLYAELLDKYPAADVSLDVGLAGLPRRGDG